MGERVAAIRNPAPGEELLVGLDREHVQIQHIVGRIQLLPYPMASDVLQQLMRAAYVIDPTIGERMERANDGFIRVRKHEDHVYLFLDIVRHTVALSFVDTSPLCFLTPDLAVDLAAGMHLMVEHGQNIQAHDMAMRAEQPGNETRH